MLNLQKYKCYILVKALLLKNNILNFLDYRYTKNIMWRNKNQQKVQGAWNSIIYFQFTVRTFVQL